MSMVLQLDSIKPVFGQFGDVLILNHVFVGFLALLDSVKSVLGQFMVGNQFWDNLGWFRTRIRSLGEFWGCLTLLNQF